MSKYLKYFVIINVIILLALYTSDRFLKFSKKHFIGEYGTKIDDQLNISADNSHIKPGGFKQSRIYKILFWTGYFNLNVGPSLVLNTTECDFSNCILTNNKNDLPKSDAVLFHWYDINESDLPKLHQHGQIWILYNWEAPNQGTDLNEWINKEINWFITYRTDSDIYLPYGSVQRCARNEWKNGQIFNRKFKSIAWIVSRCETQSNRELYVKQLNKSIDIDVYGMCGENQCNRDDDSCFKMIENSYKFYLSFENSLCKDYVTEKLFRTIEYDIIPIVYGSADYAKIMPNNSYINVFDFHSPEELAVYLNSVAKNRQKYNSYMKWKSNYCVKQNVYNNNKIEISDYFCDLCKKLNQNKNQIKSKPDFQKWWFDDSKCVNFINKTDFLSNFGEFGKADFRKRFKYSF